jgi:hypothetical protein
MSEEDCPHPWGTYVTDTQCQCGVCGSWYTPAADDEGS